MRKPNITCHFCSEPIYRRPKQLQTQKVVVCLECRGKSSKESATKQAKGSYEQFILRWKNGEESGMKGKTGISRHIRKYLFIKCNFACNCGWNKVNPVTGKSPLEVNHIDGNYMNNVETNLELLCPNCHSLTPNYKSLNLGKGRPRK